MNKAQAKWLHSLYVTYAETLYRIARYRLRDEDRAQDVLHSVFLAAAQKAPQLQSHENPLGWLLRALNYEISHEFARQARRAHRECRLPEGGEDLPQALPPSLGLEEVLPAGLPARDRELLLLFYQEGLSYREIAQRLNIPPATCGTWLARARERCRQALAPSD